MAQGRKENRLWAERKDGVAILAGLPRIRQADGSYMIDGEQAISLLFNAPVASLRDEVAKHRARMVAELKAQRAKEDALIAEHDANTTPAAQTDSKQATGTDGKQAQSTTPVIGKK